MLATSLLTGVPLRLFLFHSSTRAQLDTDEEQLPLARLVTSAVQRLAAPTLFALRSLIELCLLTPCILYLFSRVLPRASFKLRLFHYFWSVHLFACPLLYITPDYCGTLTLAAALLIATVALLAIDFPLFAGVTMTLAINLELSLITLLPAVFLYAIMNIVANSPRIYIVKQVDYIVWRVIFLLINFALVNATIWWDLITKPQTTEFDFSRAR